MSAEMRQWKLSGVVDGDGMGLTWLDLSLSGPMLEMHEEVTVVEVARAAEWTKLEDPVWSATENRVATEAWTHWAFKDGRMFLARLKDSGVPIEVRRA